MKKILRTILLLIAVLWCGLALAQGKQSAQDTAIAHLEPPFWWVGMQHQPLQLVVHGPNIADLTPSLVYPGVELKSVTRPANKNYLFLNLLITDKASPGTVNLLFKQGDKILTVPYTLRARDQHSAQRKSLGAADVVLNLMPDRFANGKPDNDSVPRLLEKSHRADPNGRHGGDIQGISDRLDYIAAMGYTAIWPTPLLENNAPTVSYHGYAPTDHYRIDARYGSNEEYLALIRKARGKGVGVVMDVVLNHIGSGHWWMRDLPSRDWINFDGKFVPTEHFRTTTIDPYRAKSDAENFFAGWFTDTMPDLNQRNPQLANYLIQNTIWWIEYADLYGIRIDTLGYSDAGFLREWGRRVTAEYPHFTMLGEEWSISPNLVSRWQKGKKNHDGYVPTIPGMIDFPLHDALRKALPAEESWDGGLIALYEMVAHDFLYPDPSRLMLFDGNHDVPRLFSALNEDMGLYRMAMSFILTMPRIPQLYYGSEILMTSPKQRDDAATRQDFPGGWPGDRVDAVSGRGLTAQQLAAQAFLKKLLNWRKNKSVVHHGKLIQFGPVAGVYVYFRYDEKTKLMVILNKNKTPTSLATARFAEMLDGVISGIDVLSGETYRLEQEVLLPARSALILELSGQPGQSAR